MTGRFQSFGGALRYQANGLTVTFDGSAVTGFESLVDEFESGLNAALGPSLAEVPLNESTGNPLFPCAPGPAGDASCLVTLRAALPLAVPGLQGTALVGRNAACIPRGQIRAADAA